LSKSTISRDPQTLKVVIEDENGTLLSDENGTFLVDSVPVFHNTYRAAGELALGGTKELSGHTLAAGQFSFLLYEGNTLLQTVGNEAGENQSNSLDYGAFAFDAIQYTQSDVGSKTYRIVEQNEGLPGYTYDDAAYEINVNVLDQDDGTVMAEIASIEKISGDVAEAVDAIVFANTYSAEDLNVSFAGTKTLSAKEMEDGQFTFVLTGTQMDGTPVQEIERVTNQNGQIQFSPLTFTQEDRGNTFYYQVSEENAMIPGIACDERVYSIALTVVDDGDGTLSEDVKYYVDGVETDGISFENVYSAADTLTIAATKNLSGKKMVKDEFGFVWQQVDPVTGAALGEKVIVGNTSTGDVFFPPIQYTEADHDKDFAYQIYEVDEKVPGMTYDRSKYVVRVHVTDMGDGTLQLDRELYKKTMDQTEYQLAEAITFNNSYQTPDEGFPNDAENVDTGDHDKAPWFGFFALLGIAGAAVSLTAGQRKKDEATN
jgi:pilin isopeptide linkage protein